MKTNTFFKPHVINFGAYYDMVYTEADLIKMLPRYIVNQIIVGVKEYPKNGSYYYKYKDVISFLKKNDMVFDGSNTWTVKMKNRNVA